MTVKITIQNVSKVLKKMDNVVKTTHQTVPKTLLRAGIYTQGKVKNSIAGNEGELRSIDTGRFLNSVGVRKLNKSVEVYSDLIYARSLEFGRKGLKERRHFRNTAQRETDKIKQLISSDIKSQINNEMRKSN